MACFFHLSGVPLKHVPFYIGDVSHVMAALGGDEATRIDRALHAARLVVAAGQSGLLCGLDISVN